MSNDDRSGLLAVWPVGSAVTAEGTELLVVLIRIRAGGVDYNCEWLADQTLCSAWFDDWRLKPANGTERGAVGFKPVSGASPGTTRET